MPPPRQRGRRGDGSVNGPGFPDPIRVDGLRELQRSLRAIDKDLGAGVKLAGNRAAQLVVDDARPRIPLGPGRGGHARDSLKVASTGKAVRVSAGGKRYPYYPWLDFGGGVGPGKRSKRPFLTEGRYIWASFADRRADVERVLDEELQTLARSAGLEAL